MFKHENSFREILCFYQIVFFPQVIRDNLHAHTFLVESDSVNLSLALSLCMCSLSILFLQLYCHKTTLNSHITVESSFLVVFVIYIDCQLSFKSLHINIAAMECLVKA